MATLITMPACRTATWGCNYYLPLSTYYLLGARGPGWRRARAEPHAAPHAGRHVRVARAQGALPLPPTLTLTLTLALTLTPTLTPTPTLTLTLTQAHRLYVFSDAALLAAPRRASMATAPRALAIGVTALLDR